MSRLTGATHFLDGLSRLGLGQWLLRAAIVVLPVTAYVALAQAGAEVHLLVVAPLTVLVLLSALMPDSHAPLVVVMTLGFSWVIQVDQPLSGWLLVAMAGLLGFHVACLLAGYGPPSVVLDPGLLRLWLPRAGVALAAGVLSWAVARLLTGLEVAGHGWLLAVALSLVVGWAALLSRKLVVES